MVVRLGVAPESLKCLPGLYWVPFRPRECPPVCCDCEFAVAFVNTFCVKKAFVDRLMNAKLINPEVTMRNSMKIRYCTNVGTPFHAKSSNITKDGDDDNSDADGGSKSSFLAANRSPNFLHLFCSSSYLSRPWSIPSQTCFMTLNRIFHSMVRRWNRMSN